MTSAQIQTLRTELQTNPLGLGYATLVTRADDAGGAAILNDISLAAAGPKVAVASLTSSQLFKLIDKTEFLALTQLKLSQLQVLLATGTLDPTDSNTKALFLAIFPAGGATATAVGNALTRTGTRAEQLFGAGVVATAYDFSQAR